MKRALGGYLRASSKSSSTKSRPVMPVRLTRGAQAAVDQLLHAGRVGQVDLAAGAVGEDVAVHLAGHLHERLLARRVVADVDGRHAAHAHAVELDRGAGIKAADRLAENRSGTARA